MQKQNKHKHHIHVLQNNWDTDIQWWFSLWSYDITPDPVASYDTYSCISDEDLFMTFRLKPFSFWFNYNILLVRELQLTKLFLFDKVQTSISFKVSLYNKGMRV